MGKHLTLDQRITIQVELERNTPIKAIARKIGKAPRTVARLLLRPAPHQPEVPVRAQPRVHPLRAAPRARALTR